MAAEEYEALNEETDDPDVAFLSGSDDVEFRPGKAKISPQKQKQRRASKRLSQTMRPRPSRAFSPVLWIVLLCLLLGGLVIALIVILYHRSEDISRRTTFRQLQEDFALEKSLPNHVESHGKSLSKQISINESNCMWKNKRLPDTMAPKSYDLNLQVDMVRENYTGSVKIEFDVLMPTSLIVVHAKKLAVTSAELKKVNGKSGEGEKLVIKHMETCAELEQFELSLGSFLSEKFRYSLTLRFSANLSQSMDGFYVSHYRNTTGHDRTLAATQFEPVYARSAFPCFDEPHLKAAFRVRILHDKDLTAVSNTPVESRSYSRVDPSRVETVFKATPVMSTYLLAFVISDFTAVPGQKHPISIDLYVTADKANQTGLALTVAPKVVSFFADFFDIPYPLEKLDLAAIPDFSAGAMENWGLITFREGALLYDPDESGLDQMDRVAIVVAHEVAHQWFGNLVTMAWWDQLWLNEGFAAFMEYLGANATNPELHIMLKHLDSDVQNALALDSLLSTHPVVAAVDDPMEIAARFDDISYKKGSTILWMLHEALGPDVFRRGVTRYLKAHKYQNAETKALWEALNEVWQNATDVETVGLTVENIANSWTIQPGFPLLTASRTSRGVKIVQARLVPFREKVPFSSKWYVPLSLVTSLGGQPEKSWMTDMETEIAIPAMQQPKWYRLKQVGMYRVTYDDKNWKAISGALKHDHNQGFMPEDRATLIDDALSLSKYGLLNVTFALDVVSYLKKENHYLPRKSAEPYLRGLESLLYGTSSFRKFRKWRQEIVRPVFEQTDCPAKNRTDILSRRLCIQLFQEACYAGVEACVKQAMDIFSGLRKSNTRVPVDIRRSVYGTAMRHGTDEDWDFLWERYRTTAVASEKDLILKALGATENMAIIKQLLRDALNESLVRQSDIFSVIGALSENLVARDQVWTTVRHNWDLFLKRYGVDSAIATFFMCLEWMSTQAELDELKLFFEFPGRSLGAGLLAYKQMLETIGLHQKFLDLYHGDLDKWLNANVL